MKNSTKVTFLIESGVSLKTISKMNENQINLMVERFKRSNKKETSEAWTETSTTSKTLTAPVAEKNLPIPAAPAGKTNKITVTGGTIQLTQNESEMTEDADVDTLLNPDEFGGNVPVNYKNPEDYGTDNGDDPNGSLDGMPTEGVIKEKFESKAQQGLFWARCEKCTDKNCKWCKMAKEFSDSTSKKQYKNMPEKKHPEKTVKYKKEKTNEGTQKYWETKILRMLEEEKKKKSQKKNSESMILRKPKKMTMFSDEAPMELPIAKMFSIGKK
jgi:hypothetical protein